MENTGESLYMKKLIKWGIGAMSFACVANFLPPIYIWIRYGYFPGVSMVLQVWGLVAAAYGISWLAQPVSYFPVIGVAGSYVGWLAGSVGDIRMTGAQMGLKAADADPTTYEGKILSNIATCTTVFVSASFVTIFTICGSALVLILPASVQASFTYILPALFCAIYADLVLKKPKYNITAYILVVLFFLFSKKVYTIPGWGLTIGSIILGILASRFWYVQERKAKA